jgi:hypothetical protein
MTTNVLPWLLQAVAVVDGSWWSSTAAGGRRRQLDTGLNDSLLNLLE